jgi:hypothetical protein
LDYEVDQLNFGLEPSKEAELPSEFQMDVEVGRRMTGDLHSDAIDPIRQSIEAGRRAESPRPSLPFSPLRTPTKAIVDFEFEQAPLNEDFYLEDGPAPQEPAVQGIEPVRKSTRVRKTHNRRPVSLDDETEIPNSTVQEHVRDATPILLPKATWSDHFLAESLQALSLTCHPVRAATKKESTIYQEDIIEQVPLNDYALGPEDYAIDAPIPHSAKSPRLMHSEPNDENEVPEFNNRSTPGTPSKPRSRADSVLNMPLGEESLDALCRWQQAFSGTAQIAFDKLIAAPGRRKQAADAFLQLLILHTKDLVRIEQLVPYGSIMVRPTSNLFLTSPEAISLS